MKSMEVGPISPSGELSVYWIGENRKKANFSDPTKMGEVPINNLEYCL